MNRQKTCPYSCTEAQERLFPGFIRFGATTYKTTPEKGLKHRKETGRLPALYPDPQGGGFVTLPPTAPRSAENEAPIGAQNQAPGYPGNQPPGTSPTPGRSPNLLRSNSAPSPGRNPLPRHQNPAPSPTPGPGNAAPSDPGNRPPGLPWRQGNSPQNRPGGQTRGGKDTSSFFTPKPRAQAHLCRENQARNQRHTVTYESYLIS